MHRCPPAASRDRSLLAVAPALALSAAGVLRWRLGYYQAAAQQAQVEFGANTLNLALQLHVGDQLARQRPVDYAAVARENPGGLAGAGRAWRCSSGRCRRNAS